MPKFQSTVNPKEIIEVDEQVASVLRSPAQTGWKEYVEEKVLDLPANRQQSTDKATGKRGVVSKPKRVQQANRGTRKSNKKGS